MRRVAAPNFTVAVSYKTEECKSCCLQCHFTLRLLTSQHLILIMLQVLHRSLSVSQQCPSCLAAHANLQAERVGVRITKLKSWTLSGQGMGLAMTKTIVNLASPSQKGCCSMPATAFERQDQRRQPAACRGAAVASSAKLVSRVLATNPHLDAGDVSQASPTQQDGCQRCIDEQGQHHDP